MSGHIRRARLDDRPRITEIRLAVRENRLTDPSRVTDADYLWFSENPGIWVWEEDGHILGFSAADTRDGTIWALFIDPGHEGRGIGRALLAKACDVLREAGHRIATLGTEPGSRADRFYRQAGWTALAHRPARRADPPPRPSEASSSIRFASTCAPAPRSAASVCSLTLWLRPATDGTKIIAVGQIRCIICASWPAPDGMRRVVSFSALA